jgi:hypothetical protein
LSAAASVNDSNVLASRACQACLIALEKAQTDNVLSISANFVSKFPGVRSWAAGRGLLLLRSGKAAEAQEVLDRFDHRAIQRLFREPGGSAGVAFLAELAVTCGDVAKSAQLYDLCAPTRHRFATLGYAMAYLGSFARYAGLLAGRLGLHDEAIEHHEYAISAERRNGAPTWRMLAEVDLHDACSTGNRSTDMKLPSLTDVEQAALSRGFTYVGFQAHRVRAKIDRAAV